MVIGDYFGRMSKEMKRDYAAEFKDALQNNEIEKAMRITDEWKSKMKGLDANCGYAIITLTAIGGEDINKLTDLFKRIGSASAENESLKPWFKELAEEALKTMGANL